MCTLTWTESPTCLSVRMNRDEQLDREKALNPQLKIVNGVRVLSPVDGRSGGTWIAANEFGLIFCLVNGYSHHDRDTIPRISRGSVIPRLAASANSEDCKQSLEKMNLTGVPSFFIYLLQYKAAARGWHWNGKDLKQIDAESPVISSSLDPDGVGKSRRAAFDLIADKDEFHRCHLPYKGAYSCCVHRDDVETVSYSKITVTDDTLCFDYTQGSPCLSLQTVSSDLVLKPKQYSLI